MSRLREILSFPARQSRVECVHEWLEVDFLEVAEMQRQTQVFSEEGGNTSWESRKMS